MQFNITGLYIHLKLIQNAVFLFSQHSNYNTAINYLITVPKYRIQAQEIARQEGLLGSTGNDSSKKNRGRKTMSKQEEDAILKRIVEQKLDIKGGYKKPSKRVILIVNFIYYVSSFSGITRILWLQLILFPYYLFSCIKWYIRWVYKFHLNQHELGEDEKIYLICRYLKINREQYDSLPEREQYDMWERKIWIKENFVEWKTEKEEEQKKKLSESGRYKAYRRYMKSGGPGQITFDGE